MNEVCRRRWTEKDIAELEVLWNSDIPVKEIAERLNRKYSAIVSEAKRIGLQRRKKRFTKKEDCKIEDSYKSGTSISEIANNLKRSEGSIGGRVSKLDIESRRYCNKSSRDITGQRFGKLTAIKKVESGVSPCGTKYSRWLCKCDCGNEIVVRKQSLVRGETKSCGCLRKKETKEANGEV